jgi:hypothetical protein
LIETSKALESNKVVILDGLPPLGTKVTAYGFPLGSEFGIGLTATGGQITREPAIPGASGSRYKDADTIRTSMWHDAETSHGSSGGPLFTEHGVLVGLHFGSLKEEGGHGMAVPPNEIASFVMQTNSAAHVKFIQSDELPSADSKEHSTEITVYIEVLGSTGTKRTKFAQTDLLSRVRGDLETKIKSSLPGLSEDDFRKLESGDATSVYSPTHATDVHSGDVARIRGKMDVIQILNDGILIRIDGVMCKLAFTESGAREMRAKFGSQLLYNLPIDGVLLVGDAADYVTVVGATNSYLPLISVASLTTEDEFKKLFEAEHQRRQEEKRIAAEDRRKAELAERQKLAAQAAKRLRHTFTDVTGKFTLDAVAIKLDSKENTLQLIRFNDKALVKINLDQLCDDDRSWLHIHSSSIQTFGDEVGELLQKSVMK